MKNRGFSLIEVIVAVAIIGILSGIVGLKLRSYIATSKDTRAVATLNSFRLAAQTYQIDNDKPLIEDSSKYDDDTEIKKALKKSNLTGKDITAVACVGHGKGLYVLDKNRKEFINGILSTDGRAGELANKFENEIKNR